MLEEAAKTQTMSRSRPDIWDQDWEFILNEFPEYPAAYFDFSAHSRECGCLDPKMRELICFATNGSPSHFFARGLRHHARQAVAQGATIAELVATLAVVSTVGAQSLLLGAQLLGEEISGLEPRNRSAAADDTAAAREQQATRVRSRHIELLGEPIPEAERAIRSDPEFYDRWLSFAAACFGPQSALGPKGAHLVAIATLVQCTQLSAPGVRQHIRAALVNGATDSEILDACKLVTGMGVHAMIMGIPQLRAEFQPHTVGDGP